MYKSKLISNVYYLVLTAFTFAAIVGFGVYQYRQKTMYRHYVSNIYKKSLYDVAGYMDDVEKLLAKAPLLKIPEQNAPLYAEIWKQSTAAHENLITMPYNIEMTSSVLKYLSQVSDFSYSMMIKSIDGEDLNAEDRAALAQIKEYSRSVSAEFNTTIANVNLPGDISWNTLHEESSGGVNTKALLGSLAPVSKTLQNYPSLIYDGPFSDHIQNMKPLMLEDKEYITQDDGENIVRQICALSEKDEVYFLSETPVEADAVIPVYSYKIIKPDAPDIYIDITKQGGLPLWMLNGEDISGAEYKGTLITPEDAVTSALKFLERNNYPGMKYSYYEISDYTMVVNFAPFTGGVIMYPDLIKVKVNLIDGSVIGLESLGYINMHHNRILAEKTLSADHARKYIADGFFVKTVAKAVIPLDSGKEAFCYEFKGSYDNEDFIIYINAETGKMEKTFNLLSNEYGLSTE